MEMPVKSSTPVQNSQDAVLHRIIEALSTPSNLQKALVIDESCVDFIVKSVLEVISMVPDVNVWMFLNASSRENSIPKDRRYGLIKNHSNIKIAEYDFTRALDLVAASMLCISKGHVVIADGRTLSRIGDMALMKLFLTCASYADAVIFHDMSPGQKAGLVEHLIGKMKKTVIWTLPFLENFPEERGQPNVLVIDTPGATSVKGMAQKEDGNSTHVIDKVYTPNLLALEHQVGHQLKNCRLSIGETKIDAGSRVTCNSHGLEEKKLAEER